MVTKIRLTTIYYTLMMRMTHQTGGGTREGGVFIDTKLKSGDDDDGGVVCCSGHFLIHCTWMEMGNICHHRHLVACVKHASP